MGVYVLRSEVGRFTRRSSKEDLKRSASPSVQTEGDPSWKDYPKGLEKHWQIQAEEFFSSPDSSCDPEDLGWTCEDNPPPCEDADFRRQHHG